MNYDKIKINLLKEAVNEWECDYINYHWKRWIDILDLVLKNISKNSKVLDIGTGGGWLSILLKESKNCDVYGIDIKREESQVWIDRFKKCNIKFSFCDITNQELPFGEETFDLVLFLDVIEHLIVSHPPYEVFDEIRRVMKPGSYLILSTSNIAALHKRVLALLGKNPTAHGYYDRKYYKKHFREYTLNELRYLISEYCGLKIENTVLTNYHFLNSNIILKALSIYPKFRDSIIIKAKK